MSKITSESTTTPTGLDTDSLLSVDDIHINDNDRSLVWKRRRRIQQCLTKHIDDLKLKQVKDGVEEWIRPMKTFRRCGFSMNGWDSVNVSVYGDRSTVNNLIDCGNPHCPYCWMGSSIKKAKKIALSLNGAFGSGYQLYFVTFTKEKIPEIEKSVRASKDWMTQFTKLVKDHSRNRKIATATYINLEFTIGRTRIQDKDWKDGKSEVFKLHAHNHACIAIHNSDMREWDELKKKIESNYVKFINDRDIETFDEDSDQVSVHWETIDTPNEGIAHYFHKVERSIKVSSEVAMSNAKKGKFGKNLGLFEALDYMEGCSRKNREAMELTIARTLVALHGKKGSRIAKQCNFLFTKTAGPLNLGKLGYDLKKRAVKSRIDRNSDSSTSQPQKSVNLFDLIKEWQQYDFSPLVDWVVEALAYPSKEQTEVELGWILQSITQIERYHVENSARIDKARILKEDLYSESDKRLKGKIVAEIINCCSWLKRGSKSLIIEPSYVILLVKLNKYDLVRRAIQALMYYEVNNFTFEWEEHDEDTVDPIGSISVPSLVWDSLQGQGKAFTLVQRIQDHVRHGAYPSLESKLSECVVPHHIDDYIIVDGAFQDMMRALDL